MTTNFPNDVLAQARNVLVGWNQFNPAPTFGPLTVTGFSAEFNTLMEMDDQIAALELQLADKRNHRVAMASSMWDKVKRVRNAVKGTYGDDSSEYEIVGGIRMSERKFRTRKRAATE